MEAAYRALFQRLPLARSAAAEATSERQAAEKRPAEGDEQKPPPRHEYDIVVCHANVIRYFTLRALQLPPEAWFRLHPKNGSITHLRVNAAGECDLFTLGDVGYMSVDENAFNMAARYPFK